MVGIWKYWTTVRPIQQNIRDMGVKEGKALVAVEHSPANACAQLEALLQKDHDRYESASSKGLLEQSALQYT